jgi:7-keto-8-aminopelargonate synthetase-like enzyme
MDGDLAPIQEIADLKDRYGAWLMIDEAHATGLYGEHGRGLAELLGVESRVDIVLGTLSKALGSAGGFVCGSKTLIDFLCNRARSLIYSTALPPPVCAAATEAVDLVMSDEGRHRRERLWRNLEQIKHGLAALGWEIDPRSPIIPLIVGDETEAVRLSGELKKRGVFVPAIRYPTVGRGKARLRVTLSAAHTADDIGRFLEAIRGDV